MNIKVAAFTESEKSINTWLNEIMSYAEVSNSVNFSTEKKLSYKLIDNQRRNDKKKLSSLHIDYI